MKRRLQKSGHAFSFSETNQKHLAKTLKKYPPERSRSVIKEALYTAQRQEGWISQEAIEAIAAFLKVAPIHVYEVATFYTLFHLAPVGRYHLQVCTTTPCWLRGSDQVLRACQKASQSHGEDVFTTTEVECLGGCANAPILQINEDYYEDLDETSTAQLLEDLAQDTPRAPGSVTGRQYAAPEGGPMVLVTQPQAQHQTQVQAQVHVQPQVQEGAQKAIRGEETSDAPG